jgi:hypothetical protein
MPSLEISEKSEKAPDVGAGKGVLSIASTEERPYLGRDHFHFVPRTETLPEYDESQESITGYDAGLMRARATLSSDEEKKLRRRIDWHLIPLLSVMYMLKSIDATNVCHLLADV